MRIAALCAVDRRDGAEDVERGHVAIPDGVFNGGLEAAAHVDDERRVAEPLDVARRQLEVVGSAPGGVRSSTAVPADATCSAAKASG